MAVESVWDYPRPPRLEPVSRRLCVVLGGTVIAETTRGHRVLETSHPPVYYFPAKDVAEGTLTPSGGRRSRCEWKGVADYLDVFGGGGVLRERAAWTYRDPTQSFEPIRNAVAFYPAEMDECTVDGEIVSPQPGGFYGGWITKDIAGPFKGGPGTGGW